MNDSLRRKRPNEAAKGCSIDVGLQFGLNGKRAMGVLQVHSPTPNGHVVQRCLDEEGRKIPTDRIAVSCHSSEVARGVASVRRLPMPLQAWRFIVGVEDFNGPG